MWGNCKLRYLFRIKYKLQDSFVELLKILVPEIKDKQSQEIIQRDWNIVAQGARITYEFADFLKEINRY